MKKDQERWITYLLLCWRWKWLILLCVAIGLGHGGYKVVTAPVFYETEVSLMISEPAGMSSSVGIVNLMQMQGENAQQLTILNILQSGRMAEDIAAHFDFEKRYKISHSSAIKKAMGMVHSSLFRNMVMIKTWAEEKQLAIDIAYFCVEDLQRLNASLEINSNKSWVKVLDPPELSVRTAGRQQQQRTMILETVLGAIIGIALVISGHEFLTLREFIIACLRYKD